MLKFNIFIYVIFSALLKWQFN